MKQKITALAGLLMVGSAVAAAPDARVEEYVYSVAGKQQYFMTSRDAEKALLAQPANAKSFVKTGRSFTVWSTEASLRPTSATPVTRFFVPAAGSHAYLTRAADIAALNARPNDFVNEGVAFYADVPSASGACPQGQKAIYRSYNNDVNGNHRYANDVYLFSSMVATGFAAEGVEFCSNSVSTDLSLQKSAGTPTGEASEVTISGTITALSSSTAFTVGSQVVDATNARIERGSLTQLALGSSVIVEGALVGNVLVANSITNRSSSTSLSYVIEGYVTAAASLSTVYVNGTRVDLTAVTTVLPVIGTRISVQGALVSGTFVATRYQITGNDGIGSEGNLSIDALELNGTISNYASLASFVINGVTVDASAAGFEHGVPVALSNGMIVEVHGILRGSLFIASRIEVRSVAFPPTATTPAVVYSEAQGAISGFVGASAFLVAGVKVDASAAYFRNGTPAMLQNGVYVDVKGTIVAGVLKASEVEFKQTSSTVGANTDVTGVVSGFISVSTFTVSGLIVDASSAFFKNGTAAMLINGAAVEVKGTLVSGVLKASEVEFRNSGSSEALDMDAKGLISNFVGVSSFTVAGVQVDASAARFKAGTAAMLQNGVRVEVKGAIVGGVLKATEVDFDN